MQLINWNKNAKFARFFEFRDINFLEKCIFGISVF
jgi:hypothetical protein